MSNTEILVLSVALGADLFSVAIPIGMSRVGLFRIFKSAAVFALFHIGMILAGYYAGQWISGIIEQMGVSHVSWQAAVVENWAKVIGALVLALLGFYMVWERTSAKQETETKSRFSLGNPLKGLALIILATSVSIDALAAGFSLGMIEVDIFKLSAILGVVIFIIAVSGLSLGRQVGYYIGAKAGLIGGIVLILLGANILWTLF